MTDELHYWLTPEYRDKYSDKDREASAEKGHAMPDGSYPIEDKEDVENAIKAVGRGNADHDAIRKHIIKNAKRLGCSNLIPDNWNSDGSLKQETSTTAEVELREEGESTATTLTATAAGGVATPVTVTRRRKERHRVVPLMPEIRHFKASGLEIREQSKTNEIVISGTPIVYDTPYSVYDMFGEFEERMAVGVASEVLERGADVRFLFNHDDLPMARTISGTMTLTDSPRALEFEARLDARQQIANDLAIAVERGDVTQMSCGFIVARDEWDEDMEHRTVLQFADLLDVSAVTYPASPTTSVQIAKRMALEMPVESRARIRKLYAEVRAGHRLTEEEERDLVAAWTPLHSQHAPDGWLVTDSANDSPAPSANGDGTVGGNAAEGNIATEDGTGYRDADDEAETRADEDEAETTEAPEEESTTRTASALRLQLEARSRLRKAA